MPAMRGGTKPSAKRNAGAPVELVHSDEPARRDLIVIPPSAMTTATNASANQIPIHRTELSGGPAANAAASAVAPISTPPQPGIAVNGPVPARDIVSRM